MKKELKYKKSGFTIIELLVVCTIIAVLAAIGMVSFSAAGKSARDGKRKSDMETTRQALTLYKQQVGSYPSGNFAAAVLTMATATYMTQPVPIDPGGNGSVPYSYSPGASSACVCAYLENAKGNTSSPDCTNLTSTTGTYYCAQSL